MQLDYASYTDIGGRDENEDSMLIDAEEDFLLASVADGLGGHGGGKAASSCAIETLSAQKHRLKSKDESEVLTVCAAINEAVLARQSAQVRMKTTLALALIDQEELRFLHIGDSRVYLFRGGEIAYQSQDHSVSQLAVLTGAIKPEQIRYHEDRNKLLRSLGSENGATPEIRLGLEPKQGDGILLCTDGFWEHVIEKEMMATLKRAKTAEDWLKNMTRLVRRRAKKGNDNNSAIALIATAPAKKPIWRTTEHESTHH